MVRENTISLWIIPMRNGIMRGSVTLDRAGRVVLPKTLREELHLSPGDTLDLTVEGESVTLRPRRIATPLQKERGVWVLRTGKSLAAAETEEKLRRLREKRDHGKTADSR
jgi:AbrB family looped-hinge helix DNA binding protein